MWSHFKTPSFDKYLGLCHYLLQAVDGKVTAKELEASILSHLDIRLCEGGWAGVLWLHSLLHQQICLYTHHADKPWLKDLFCSLFPFLFHTICNSSEAQIWKTLEREWLFVCVCKRELNYYNLHSSNYLLMDTLKKKKLFRIWETFLNVVVCIQQVFKNLQ